jgi:transposase InsO family protein
MNQEAKKRLSWIKVFGETQNAGIVCRRCGISRPTFRKWLRRYQNSGLEGLLSQNRRPLKSPARKIFPEQEQWILDLRMDRNWGARCIQNDLKRIHGFNVSLATIHKVLTKHQVKPLVRLRRGLHPKRYNRPIPGDRVQMDTCKIAPGLYQYTAIDDCTRYQVLALFPRRNAESTLEFLEKAIEEMPFPVQRIQTDRGGEFFAQKVQKRLLEYHIKFRPTKPGSPHLNGKVERAQKTDLNEFYATADLKGSDLVDRLQEWQHFYNWHRPHGSLNGKAPMDRFFELIDKTPFSDEIEACYDPSKERIREQNYRIDLLLRRMKRCL